MSSTQASRIITKFGGVPALARAIGSRPQRIYKWTYPPERGGTGGYIPPAVIPRVKEAAEFLDIALTAEDWAP